MANQRFEAVDGRLFDNIADADAHDSSLAAEDNYHQAKNLWMRTLAGRCQTADGQPFSFTFDSYYLPVEGDWPYIKSLSFSLRDCDIDAQENVQIRERAVVSNDGSPRRGEYLIANLYRDRRAAQAKLFQYQIDAINRLVKAANETAAEIGRAPIVKTDPEPAPLNTD